MLDIQYLRDNPVFIAQKLADRGFSFDVDGFLKLESHRKSLQIKMQQLQNERNTQSKSVGIAKARGENIDALKTEIRKIGDELDNLKAELDDKLTKIDAILSALPNIAHESVPIGRDEQDSLEIRSWGLPAKFNFEVRSHDELGEILGQMDFAQAAKITGSRFVVLYKHIAKLHRALIQFMLDIHVEEHGYKEVYVPCIINAKSAFGTGQLPKFAEDLFKLDGDHSYYLSSTAEIPVTNLVRDELLAEADLPMRFVCHAPCFRSEAGSYGRDTKGMIRQHQFDKVELVWITKPQDSYQALEKLTSHAEVILQRLELPYRVMTLCTGDMGATAAKTYDLEVWLPSQNTYREISSCSNTEAYQARRMKARYKELHSNTIYPVHTLNGSALAVGRTLVAILENYQMADGSVEIPMALRPYMNNLKCISIEG